MVDTEITKIAAFSESVEKLENEFKNFQEKFRAKEIDMEEFDGRKVNFLEEIKKVSYEIKQVKDLLRVSDLL